MKSTLLKYAAFLLSIYFAFITILEIVGAFLKKYFIARAFAFMVLGALALLNLLLGILAFPLGWLFDRLQVLLLKWDRALFKLIKKLSRNA